MSIATQVIRLQKVKSDIRQALVEKGVSASGHNMADFPADIESIESKQYPKEIYFTEVTNLFPLDICEVMGYHGIWSAIADTDDKEFTLKEHPVVLGKNNYSIKLLYKGSDRKIYVNNDDGSSSVAWLGAIPAGCRGVLLRYGFLDTYHIYLIGAWFTDTAETKISAVSMGLFTVRKDGSIAFGGNRTLCAAHTIGDSTAHSEFFLNIFKGATDYNLGLAYLRKHVLADGTTTSVNVYLGGIQTYDNTSVSCRNIVTATASGITQVHSGRADQMNGGGIFPMGVYQCTNYRKAGVANDLVSDYRVTTNAGAISTTATKPTDRLDEDVQSTVLIGTLSNGMGVYISLPAVLSEMPFKYESNRYITKISVGNIPAKGELLSSNDITVVLSDLSSENIDASKIVLLPNNILILNRKVYQICVENGSNIYASLLGTCTWRETDNITLNDANNAGWDGMRGIYTWNG